MTDKRRALLQHNSFDAKICGVAVFIIPLPAPVGKVIVANGDGRARQHGEVAARQGEVGDAVIQRIIVITQVRRAVRVTRRLRSQGKAAVDLSEGRNGNGRAGGLVLQFSLQTRTDAGRARMVKRTGSRQIITAVAFRHKIRVVRIEGDINRRKA